MKTYLLKMLASWLYGITADQWIKVAQWVATLALNRTLTGEQKRHDIITAARQQWAANALGDRALNWLIETAVGLAQKQAIK
jgi:hypothetical protein